MTRDRQTHSETLAETQHDPLAEHHRLLCQLEVILAESTGLQDIDPDVNILEAGVDSLMLMTMRQAIQDQMGVEIPIALFFEGVDTLRLIAERIARDRPALPAEAAQREAEAAVPPIASSKPELPITVQETGREMVRDIELETPPPVSQSLPALPVAPKGWQHRSTTQEPLAIIAADGAMLTLADGARLVDLSLDMGRQVVGYNADVVRAAKQAALAAGLPVGPIWSGMGKAAQTLTRLAQSERAYFCNGAAEAVMVAIRLARTVRGCDRVIRFAECRHAPFDGILATVDEQGQKQRLSEGTTTAQVADVEVWAYGDERVFAQLSGTRADRVAAVIIEAIPALAPQLYDPVFLRRLAEACAKTGVCFILDECLTAPANGVAGLSGQLGLPCDLKLFGPAMAAGAALGVVTGRALYLDAVDGGPWAFGDDSVPTKANTLLAGTFNGNPLAITCLQALLDWFDSHFDNNGAALHNRCLEASSLIADRLHHVLHGLGVEDAVTRVGTQIFLSGEVPPALYQKWRAYGLLLQPGMALTIGAPHVPLLDEILAALGLEAAVCDHNGGAEGFLPMTQGQQDLLFLLQSAPETAQAYHEMVWLDCRASLEPERLQLAWRRVAAAHPALRLTAFGEGRQGLVSATGMEIFWRLNHAAMQEAAGLPFDLEKGAASRLVAAPHLGGTSLLLVGHHIAVDGPSLAAALADLAIAYNEPERLLPPAVPLAPFLEAERRAYETPLAADLAFWKDMFADRVDPANLPVDRPRQGGHIPGAGRVVFALEGEELAHLREACRLHGATMTMVMFATWQVLLARLTGAARVATSVPATGAGSVVGRRLVGPCSKVFPVPLTLTATDTVRDVIHQTREVLMAVSQHQSAPITALLAADPTLLVPSTATMFNIDRVPQLPRFGGEATQMHSPQLLMPKVELFLNGYEAQEALTVELQFDTSLFNRATVQSWLDTYITLLRAATTNPDDIALQQLSGAPQPAPFETTRPYRSPDAARLLLAPGCGRHQDQKRLEALGPMLAEPESTARDATDPEEALPIAALRAHVAALADALEIGAGDRLWWMTAGADDAALAALSQGAEVVLADELPQAERDRPTHLVMSVEDWTLRQAPWHGLGLILVGPPVIGEIRMAAGWRRIDMLAYSQSLGLAAAHGVCDRLDADSHDICPVPLQRWLVPGVLRDAWGSSPLVGARATWVAQVAGQPVIGSGASVQIAHDGRIIWHGSALQARTLQCFAALRMESAQLSVTVDLADSTGTQSLMISATLIPLAPLERNDPEPLKQRLRTRMGPVRPAVRFRLGADQDWHWLDGLGDDEEDGLDARTAFVLSVFAEVLGDRGRPLGPDCDFFALGGQSLQAVQIASRIEAGLGVIMSARDLFDAPTPQALVALLEQRAKGEFLPPIAPAPQQSARPASPAQQRLWALEQVQEGALAYIVTAAFLVEAPLEPDRLRGALLQVIARHEALRTLLIEDEFGQVHQRVLADAAEALDWQVMPCDAVDDAALLAAGARLQDMRFDLASAPVVRLRLLQDDQRSGVVIALHHAHTDGWSMAALYDELSAVYGGATLPAPGLQYHDGVAWLEARDDQREQALTYWQQALLPPPEPLRLPSDSARSTIAAPPGATDSLVLTGDKLARITALAAESQVSLGMVASAAVFAALHRLTGQSDIAVGMPSVGRPHPDLEPVQGLFVNTVVVRAEVDARASFQSLILQVRDHTLAALEHDAAPFEQVVERCAAPRVAGRAPLFDVMIVLQDESALPERFGPHVARQVRLPCRYALFDLTFQFFLDADRLELRLDYRADLYHAERIKLLLERLDTLIMAGCSDPLVPLGTMAFEAAPQEGDNPRKRLRRLDL